MSIILKNDWKAVGKSATAQRLADWMNAVSDMFNNATIPSGGTATPTALGFQIEIDKAPDYHFEVVLTGSYTVSVRGGWWAYYRGKTRWQANLTGAGPLFENLTSAINVTDTGVIYLELYTPTNAVVAKFATDADWAALTDTLNTFRKLLADVTVTDSVITEILQDHRGGNVMTDELEIDGISLDLNGAASDAEVQLYNYDNAADDGVAAGDLFPYKDGGGGLQYVDIDTLSDYITGAVMTWLALDEDSIDWNNENEIELKGWKGAASSGAVNALDLIPIKNYVSPGVYDDDVIFASISDIAGGVRHTLLDYANGTWAAKGTGKGGGNTDHDESYPHFYADGFAPVGSQTFVNTKELRSSAAMWASELHVSPDGSSDPQYWTAARFRAYMTGNALIESTGGGVAFQGETTATLVSIDGPTEIISGGNVEITAANLKINGDNTGVTGDGFTNGIKTDEGAMDAAIETQINNILAGHGLI